MFFKIDNPKNFANFTANTCEWPPNFIKKGFHPTNTPRGFRVETTGTRSFPRRFNVESTWCCRAESGTQFYPVVIFLFFYLSKGLRRRWDLSNLSSGIPARLALLFHLSFTLASHRTLGSHLRVSPKGPRSHLRVLSHNFPVCHFIKLTPDHE